jgi:hypothetical protein
MSESEREKLSERAGEGLADLDVPADQSDQVRGGVDGNEDEDLDDLEIQR